MSDTQLSPAGWLVAAQQAHATGGADPSRCVIVFVVDWITDTMLANVMEEHFMRVPPAPPYSAAIISITGVPGIGDVDIMSVDRGAAADGLDALGAPHTVVQAIRSRGAPSGTFWQLMFSPASIYLCPAPIEGEPDRAVSESDVFRVELRGGRS